LLGMRSLPSAVSAPPPSPGRSQPDRVCQSEMSHGQGATLFVLLQPSPSSKRFTA
jgi:hypothetical protein